MSETKKKKFNKRFAVSIVKVIAFVLVLVLALQVLSHTLFAKERTDRFTDTKLFYTMIYTREKPDTIQVGYFGNSDLYSAVCPGGIFYQYGYTGTVVGAPRLTALEAYDYIVDFLKNQKPELIVLECDMLYSELPEVFENSGEVEKSGLPVIPYVNDNSIESIIYTDCSVFRFHDRWKQFFLDSPTKDEDYMHGYYFNKRVSDEAVRSEYIEPNDKREPIDEEADLYVRYIKELCDEWGIELMLLTVPSANTWSYARHNAVQDLADELGVNFLDLGIEPEGLNINYDHDFRDNGNHVNYYGAKKVTQYLGKYLYENYDLTNNRYNEDYAYWVDELYKMYEQKGVREKVQFKSVL